VTDVAVSVQGVSKSFRIYSEHNQSLKATVMRRKWASYEEFWALRDVSFDVPVGTTFGLMGDNGSGKSTLLKCIAKILQPNEGRIVSQGRMASMLELGSGFHPELTGRENVYLNGSILGMSRKELDAKFDEIADFAGVGAFIDQPVKNYSSGMYVRLGFSVAIHVEPDILLVDEILAVGDMSFQAKCKEKLCRSRPSARRSSPSSSSRAARWWWSATVLATCGHSATRPPGCRTAPWWTPVRPPASWTGTWTWDTRHARWSPAEPGTAPVRSAWTGSSCWTITATTCAPCTPVTT
jgi:ABC-type polysaccharide/polyol phosphate transport system ATPase subunit